MPTTDIVPVTEYAIVQQDPGTALAAMRENVGEGGLTAFDLPRITIPAGGGRTWIVPTLGGEEETKVLEGVVVYWREPRAFWHVGFDESGGGSPPDCSSDDGEFGRGDFGPGSEENPSGRCADCPMSRFGSDPKGNGQACKQMRLMFLLPPNRMLPYAIFMPPTSIRPVKDYMLSLASESVIFHQAVTRIELEQAQSGSGITYSKAKLTYGGPVPAEASARFAEYAGKMRELLDGVTFDAADFQAAASSGANAE